MTRKIEDHGGVIMKSKKSSQVLVGEFNCNGIEKLPPGGFRGDEELPPGGFRGDEELPPGGFRCPGESASP